MASAYSKQLGTDVENNGSYIVTEKKNSEAFRMCKRTHLMKELNV